LYLYEISPNLKESELLSWSPNSKIIWLTSQSCVLLQISKDFSSPPRWKFCNLLDSIQSGKLELTSWLHSKLEKGRLGLDQVLAIEKRNDLVVDESKLNEILKDPRVIQIKSKIRYRRNQKR